MDIAESIVAFIPSSNDIKSVVVAPPGFINFTLSDKWLSSQVAEILTAGDGYGDINIGNGVRIQVEFVSSNPTGPLHTAHGRGAILGSALSNVLKAAGYEVTREYYFNDAGNQMDIFNKTLFARYLQHYGKQVEIPTDGYTGGYMVELAEEISGEEGDKFLQIPESEAILQLGKIGCEKIMAQIKEELVMLRVDFDVWFTERSLYENGQFDKVMSKLSQEGYIGQRDGATWFLATSLGEEKDEVVVRSNGIPTYLGTDIAYHYNKLVERKFDRVIDIWGADHQGHIAGLKSSMKVLGADPDKLEIIIHQMITLKRGGEIVKISTRRGEFVTVREVLDEVGVDACRFFYLARSANSQMDFDLELAKKESSENPVYYVQYAHARIASILRLAVEKEIE
jgi:arginyl-tRNA synthetase